VLAIRLEDGDALAAAGLCEDGGMVLLASSGGKVANFEVSGDGFRSKGRVSQANKVGRAAETGRGVQRGRGGARRERGPGGEELVPQPTAGLARARRGVRRPAHLPRRAARYRPLRACGCRPARASCPCVS
jgi:hypothetical protein